LQSLLKRAILLTSLISKIIELVRARLPDYLCTESGANYGPSSK
jgi:hypothetical protein